MPILQPSQYHLLLPCLFLSNSFHRHIRTIYGHRRQRQNKHTGPVKQQVQTMLMISGSNRGSVMRVLQREKLTKRVLLYISGHSEMTPEWGGCVARVNPYVLSNLGAARPFVLAAVSETVRNVFQLVTRHISKKQMVAYSRSGSIMLWYRRRRRRCVCTDKDDFCPQLF